MKIIEGIAVETGIKAYEIYYKKDVLNKEISVVKYSHSSAVYMCHIETGIEVYSNDSRCNRDNWNNCLIGIKAMMGLSNSKKQRA